MYKRVELFTLRKISPVKPKYVLLTCKNCKIEFTVVLANSEFRKYCSPTCALSRFSKDI